MSSAHDTTIFDYVIVLETFSKMAFDPQAPFVLRSVIGPLWLFEHRSLWARSLVKNLKCPSEDPVYSLAPAIAITIYLPIRQTSLAHLPFAFRVAVWYFAFRSSSSGGGGSKIKQAIKRALDATSRNIVIRTAIN